MPDAGALVRARSLDELLQATAVLDKAAYADITAESKGACTQSLNPFSALLEHLVYRIKSSKNVQTQNTADLNVTSSEAEKAETNESANPSEEEASASESAQSPADSNDAQPQGDADGESSAGCEEKMSYVKFDLEGDGTAILAHPYYCGVICAIGKSFAVPEE